MIARWFTKSGYLNTAMSTSQATIQLLGSTAAFFILPRFHSLAIAQWFVVAVGLFSLTSNLIYVYFEKRYESYLKSLNDEDQEENENESEENIESDLEGLIGKKSDTVSVQGSEYMVVKTKEDDHQKEYIKKEYSDHDTEKSEMASSRNDSTLSDNDNDDDSAYISNHSNNVDDQVRNTNNNNDIAASTNIKDMSVYQIITSLPRIFWFSLLHAACIYPILYTFTAYGPFYLQESFKSIQTIEDAGNAISLLYFAIAFSPLSGMVIDRIGHRVWVQLVASINILIMFLILKYVPWVNPLLCLFYMGLLFSITESNILAIISYTVPPDRLGTAYGLFAWCSSIMLVIEPLVVGYMKQTTNSFALSIWLYIDLVILSVIFMAIVLIMQTQLKLIF